MTETHAHLAKHTHPPLGHPLGRVSVWDDPGRFGKIWLGVLGAMFLLFLCFPKLDLGVARQLYLGDRKFWLSEQPLAVFIHENVEWLLWVALATLAVIGLARVMLKRAKWSEIGRQGVMAAVAALVGPGLVANALFKDMWGRARPLQLFEFGGQLKFTPPLVWSDQCSSNCSFVGGDAALGFWLFIFAFMAVSTWRRALFWLAVAVGGILGLVRIGQGAHFLSDILFSAWFMLGVSYSLAQVFSPHHTQWHKIRLGVQRIGHFLGQMGHEIAHPAQALHHQGLRRKLPYVLILIALTLILVDVPASHLAYQLSPVPRQFFKEISDIALGKWYLVGMPLLAVMLVAAAAVMRFSRHHRAERKLINWVSIPAMIWVAVVLSGLAANLMKWVIGRYRPEVYFLAGPDDARFGLHYFSHAYLQNSFPSGHTTTAFAVATCLWLFWPRGGFAFLAFGLVVAVTRVLAGAHWPSDVVAGGFVGFASAIMLHRIMNRYGWGETMLLAGQKFSRVLPNEPRR
ncbi:MAG: phosphatase PAP2 family protein [Candidatus Symbiobacter sp.]|nr:phosphatase PAP2 family protein [Candidatus Symbiobacter sp.]